MRFKFVLLLSLITSIVSANTITAVTLAANPGDWTSTTTWSPATVPQSGDIVMIPVGTAVSVQSQVYSTTPPTLTIKVSGVINFHPSGKLDLSNASSVQLYALASIVPQNTSNSQLINIGGVTKYSANINFTVTGPAFASAATGTSTTGQVMSGWTTGVLPVKLVSFTAAAEQTAVRLNWTTAEEQNTDHFAIERSTDGGANWTSVERVMAKGQATSYAAYDRNTSNDVVYYRLKTVDADGRFSFSAIVKLSRGKSASINITPNPATSFIRVSLDHVFTEKVTVRIINGAGQTVNQSDFAAGSNLMTISTTTLPKGVYTVVVGSGSALLDSRSILIQ